MPSTIVTDFNPATAVRFLSGPKLRCHIICSLCVPSFQSSITPNYSLQWSLKNSFALAPAPLCSLSNFITPVTMSMGDSVATVIDGKAVAKQIREEIAMEISRMKEQIGTAPGLAVILVGARKDSQTYVRNKKKACEAVGIASFEINLPEDCTEEQVIQHIDNFNSNPSVHGILIQLPLPRDPESARGYKLVGDVCYEEVCKRASAITPVPGGVGPMTIAMLLSNTLLSAKRFHKLSN